MSSQIPQSAQATFPAPPCGTCRLLQRINCISEEQANHCPHNRVIIPMPIANPAATLSPLANTTNPVATTTNPVATTTSPVATATNNNNNTTTGPSDGANNTIIPPPRPPTPYPHHLRAHHNRNNNRPRPPTYGSPFRNNPIDPRTHAINPHRRGHRGPLRTTYNMRRYYGRSYDPWAVGQPVEDVGEAMDDGLWRERLPVPEPEGGERGRRFVFAPLGGNGGENNDWGFGAVGGVQGVQGGNQNGVGVGEQGQGQGRVGGRDGGDGENGLPEVPAPGYAIFGEDMEMPPPAYEEVSAAASQSGQRAHPPTYDETIVADIHPPQDDPTQHRPPYLGQPPQYQHTPHPDETYLNTFRPANPVVFDGKPRQPPGYILRNPESRQAWYDWQEREPGMRQNARCPGAAQAMMQGRTLRLPERLKKKKEDEKDPKE